MSVLCGKRGSRFTVSLTILLGELFFSVSLSLVAASCKDDYVPNDLMFQSSVESEYSEKLVSGECLPCYLSGQIC